MPVQDLWRLDATALSRMLDARDVTPHDLLTTFFERYERLNPQLNAFCFLDREGAARAADEAAKRQQAGRRLGPLDGIPVSIKDNLFVRGMPATWGSNLFKDHTPDRDDICVERLRAGGAVIVGKTTTPEFALMGKTQSRLQGVTVNPWDPRLTPGGSSGGAVASVAAGITPLAFGTDAGGSTRMPAGYTGLVGLRPSNGRVPRRYGFPPMALDLQAIGLICRTMADLDLLLSIVGGADRRDVNSLNLPPLTAPSGRLRIGWFTHHGEETIDAEVKATHRAAREALASLGHDVAECAPPYDIGEFRAIWDAITMVGAARVATRFPSWREDLGPQIAGLAAIGSQTPAIEYARAIDRLQAFRAETSSRWGDYDVLLLPTSAAPAFPAGQDAPATIGGKPGKGATQGMFCGWVNAMGYAGLNVPGLPHPDGRPIGLQIVAPFGRDGLALEIGRQLEKLSPWRDRWPPMAS